jgi:hypothetical protein
MAFNGTGSNVTSLNASNVASGTLAVARGGTGTASPSLVGGTNITISGSWPNQTVTASGGGVTSLNGQTGAITDTNLYAIGSYIIGRPQNITNYGANSTIAGSSLYSTIALAYIQLTCCGTNPTWMTASLGGSPARNLISTGTWRCISPAPLGGFSANNGISGLWVRIS